jgi:hypothetical protein
LDEIEDMEDDVLNAEMLGGANITNEELKFIQDKFKGKVRESGKDREKLSKDLDELHYLRAKKLAKFPQNYDAFEPNNMTSFSENRINKILIPDAGFQVTIFICFFFFFFLCYFLISFIS